MSHRVYLKVPFIEKDQAKNLGAKFDFNQKSWYINSSQSIDIFSRWLGDNLIKEQPIFQEINQETHSIQQKHFSLLNFLHIVQQKIEYSLNDRYWVKAEIAQLKEHKKNYYFDFIQREQNTADELAKARAILWRNNQSIISEFEKLTAKQLKPGLSILFEVKCRFSVRYGFSLEIISIDANHTIGEFQRKKQEIFNTLIKEKLYNLNRQLSLPTFINEIAVISPKEAAGLADFKYYIEPLNKNKILQCRYIEAPFQGDTAAQKIGKAIDTLFAKQNNIQLLIIIRGGGGKSDLQYLEEEQLIRKICQCPVPVWVGVGHQIDSLLIDEVAHKNFPTPTAVANEIIKILTASLKESILNWQEIKFLSQQKIRDSNTRCHQVNLLIQQQTYNKVIQLRQKLNQSYINYQNNLTTLLNHIQFCLKEKFFNIKLLGEQLLAQKQKATQTLRVSLNNQSQQILTNKKSTLYWIKQMIEQNNPEKILKRGFAIIKDEQNKVLNLEQMKTGKTIKIQMSQGHKQATISK